jgi:hypothetical protein
MSTRDAIDTLTGYFYQFDHAITKLLEMNSDDFITVEGIEDIDTKTVDQETAIQCKYYAKTEYNHSVISKPIRLMLNHFKEVKEGKKQPVNYYLYGHYKKGHEKLEFPITVNFLKEKFLTYTKKEIKYFHHNDLCLTDADLNDFIKNLTININAVGYEEQLSRLLILLEKEFNCSRFEAENYYYNNSLKIIKDLSIKSEIDERKISKKQFLNCINNKETLFNEWFLLLKGKREYLKNLRKEFFTSLNTSPFERFFLIELSEDDYLRANVKEVLFLIAEKWSNLSKRNPTPFCPYIYLHNFSDVELIELKKELFQERFKFVDGYSFMGATFSPDLLSESATVINQIKIKILNNLQDLSLTLKYNQKTKEVYQFYKKTPFYEVPYEGIKHVRIQYELLNDIKEII